MASYVADFETTTDPTDCRVWAYAICEVGNKDNIKTGTTIDDFMNLCRISVENDLIYFHNLKFDSQFIINWLFRNGFKHTTDPKDKASNTFNTIISDKGLFYQIEVIFYKRGKRVNKVVFQDSLKLIPLAVEDIAESFKLPINKLKIDYDAHNNQPEGADLTDEEKEYIKHDVLIVAYALEYFYSLGYNKMTIGACALSEYKEIITKNKFDRFFPVPKYHDDVKQSYKGGFTWVNPKYAEKTIGNGVVLDINSLFPSVMYYNYLPYGTPIFFKGQYKPDPIYPLYTQMLRCQFRLKKGKIPTIQIKHGYDFRGSEYLENSGDTEVVLCLNSVDLEMFLDHYDVFNIEYLSGWKFKSDKGLFKDYIDKWSTNKIQAKETGNHGLYLISKLFLNSLYGKFGTSTTIKEKIPYLDHDKQVRYKDSGAKHRDGVYIALASFVTSYARKVTITSAQKIMDDYNSGKSNIEFLYADTDSLHLKSDDFSLPDLDIDPVRLGAWKYESKFNKARFLRQKCYIENSCEDVDSDDPQYKLKITVAGMPDSCYPNVNFNNFKIGATYEGKLVPKLVPNGIVLEKIDFTIQKV